MTEAQKDFFKDSQVRNNNGDLITCYHYTVHQFDAFDKTKIGNMSGDNGYFGTGFYFTGRPNFNSCCFPDKEAGEELIKLECYLNLKNPFYMEKLGKPDYKADDPYIYDAESFLRYIKDNSDEKALNGDGSNIVLCDDDFVHYLKQEHAYDGEYRDLIEQYEAGSIRFDDEVDGISLENLYWEASRNTDIITPNNITFDHLHRGILAGYSSQITAYAKSHGFDGIISDGFQGTLSQPTEIVVFEPNQIKAVDNLYPTLSTNFRNNKEEYFIEQQQKPEPRKEQSAYLKRTMAQIRRQLHERGMSRDDFDR